MHWQCLSAAQAMPSRDQASQPGTRVKNDADRWVCGEHWISTQDEQQIE